MASISMAMPMTTASQKRVQNPPSSNAFFNPLPVKQSKAVFVSNVSKSNLEIEASMKEKVITGLSGAFLTASMVVPEMAQAADSMSPSLKNFLVSIGSGGFVLFGIIGAVIGVSNFDPVKRS